MDPGSSLDYNTLHHIRKPDIPYANIGSYFTVREHFPPPPRDTLNIRLSKLEQERRMTTDILTRCIDNNPVSGEMGTLQLTLRTLNVLQVRDSSTSQVVLVKIIKGHLANVRVVAKFYDPLYYNHQRSILDPFLCVEEEYTRETAAYQHLHKHGLSDYIPQFCGSYSLDMPVPDRGIRQVRLILVEFMSGSSMNRLRPGRIAVETRQHILEQIVRAESRFYAVGLQHKDLYRRNIMVEGIINNDPTCRPYITIIDFGRAYIGHPTREYRWSHEDRLLPIYISPIIRWYCGSVSKKNDFIDWCDWEWKDWLRKTFAKDDHQPYHSTDGQRDPRRCSWA
ncbi:hypothetical protein BO82DRAFT_421965 [Aspergillus uvarum CBS 121591]|uniref:Protein kinase domain-containing protein n=1 Tax=Aspergillus uvarum CBS 121591 TaxID=1448315 RepID=A0A319C2G8_9EURO|nr:hypothetical protein BO82DRAFT_421965 [Aspergillus uvarum CBS 121591]PYH78347.1 hypothetical protein BO82DRAFT_421965 [Aspergillus uvarum CBS 121591]